MSQEETEELVYEELSLEDIFYWMDNPNNIGCLSNVDEIVKNAKYRDMPLRDIDF